MFAVRGNPLTPDLTPDQIADVIVGGATKQQRSRR